MVDWRQLLELPDNQLRKFDIVETNLSCAVGLPGAGKVDLPKSKKFFDCLAKASLTETVRQKRQFHERPGEFNNSEAFYCVMAMTTVLQRDFRIHYRMHTLKMDDDRFFSRADNLFVNGIVEGNGGTCSSLPVAFAAVGRRLGYPIRVVRCNSHLFARWESPHGERFNIECTSRGLISYPDEHYLQWPVPTTPELAAQYGALRSMTPRQEVAAFLMMRGRVCLRNGLFCQSIQAFAGAWQLDPGLRGPPECLVEAMNRWDEQLNSVLFVGFPGLSIIGPPRCFPAIPLDLEQGVVHMLVKQNLLADAGMKKQWWDPIRRNPSVRPANLPAFIHVDYSNCRQGVPGVTLYRSVPSWVDRSQLRRA